MNRAALAAELWGRLQRPFAEVGITNSDTTGNLKEPLDATFLALGVAYGDVATGTVASGDELKAITVAVYYGLDAVYRGALNKVDTSVGAPQVSRSSSQMVANLKAALDAAKQAALPYLPDDGGTWGSGTITLGFLEPQEYA